MASADIDREAPAYRIALKFAEAEAREGRSVAPLSALARAFDPPKAPSTVHRWLVSGDIPTKHHDDTWEAARRLRVKLKPADFLRLPPAAKAA